MYLTTVFRIRMKSYLFLRILVSLRHTWGTTTTITSGNIKGRNIKCMNKKKSSGSRGMMRETQQAALIDALFSEEESFLVANYHCKCKRVVAKKIGRLCF